ncbi:MAG: hypothetical protein R8N23_09525 [Reichenbachiella sp.]|uniref:hypothetical protein n=1 Tax=Reichenbachiella sp. TaxID=2184521 RepID=UPI002966F19F|nr:hypothetical protein [Reichenbachiella sp.]MDW3210097.1 hypothetical protein [Reichenbachiella sp.]
MNTNKIFSNWFYIFLFFWTLLATLCLLTIGITYAFFDEPITQRTFLFTGFWLTFFSLLTATILYSIRRYSIRYANKNDGKSPLPINKKNWPIQGLKIGIPGFILILIFHWIMGQDITMNSLLFASFFILVGMWSAYNVRNRSNNDNAE